MILGLLRVSLGFHSYHAIDEVLDLMRYANDLGFGKFWLDDPPSEFDTIGYIMKLSDMIDTPLGLGALSVSKWMHHDPGALFDALDRKVEMALVPGTARDRRGQDLAQVIASMAEFRDVLKSKGFTVLVGAQGPRMLALARYFDGVLLNFIAPAPVEWALNVIGNRTEKKKCLGPSLVFVRSYSDDELSKLLGGASLLRAEAAKVVRKKFPELSNYYLLSDFDETQRLFEWYQSLGVGEIVLHYPQSLNRKTIKDASKLLA